MTAIEKNGNEISAKKTALQCKANENVETYGNASAWNLSNTQKDPLIQERRKKGLETITSGWSRASRQARKLLSNVSLEYLCFA